MTSGSGSSADSPAEPSPTKEARTHRSIRLRAAVLTGGAAKGLAVAVQLLSLGIAVRALGSEAFGSYLVMASLVAWLGLAAVGVGPGLTQRIAVATANDDTRGQATAFSSSVAVAGLFVLVGVVAIFVVVRIAVSGQLSQSAITSDILAAAMLLGFATAAQVWLSVVEAAQLGHQERHVANVFQAAGLVGVLATLLVIGPGLASVTAFVAVTAIPPLVAKTANAILYVARRRYLLTRHVSVREATSLLSTSVAFAAVSLGALASQQVGFLWLAYVAGPAATVALGVMFRLNSAAYGVVALVTQPLWPALADAIARHDSVWARRAYRRASLLTLSGAVAYAIGLVTVGTLLIQLWTGTQVEVAPLMLLLFGLYFVVGVWAHVNAITLVGLGKVWVAARVIFLEAFVSIVGAALLMAQFGSNGVILSLLIATATVSATLLPRAVQRWWPPSPTTADTSVVGVGSVPSR